MIGFVRKLVAGPKNKTSWNGIELDLTYITQRIIAMAYPASGFEKTYRNSIHDVSEYFKQKHKGNCLIINVSMRQYDYELFNNHVKDYFWPDHQAPPLSTIFVICNDILEFMQKSQNGVVAVHCNHGKGRTGTCIISYMLFTRQFNSAEEALKFYNKRRFIKTTYGVDQPCQRRYLDYAQQILHMKQIEPKLKAFKLAKIRQEGLNIDNFYLQLSLTRTCQTKHTKLKLNQILKNNSIPLIGDIFIELYQNSWVGESQAVRINYNLYFLQRHTDGSYIVQFHGKNICVNGKRSRNFTLTLVFQQFCACHKNEEPTDCECHIDRIRQQKQWQIMIEMVKRVKKIPEEQLNKFVYGKNQKTVKSALYQEQQQVQNQEPIKQIYE